MVNNVEFVIDDELNEGIKVVNTAGTAEINACGDMNLEVGDLAQETISSLDQQ